MYLDAFCPTAAQAAVNVERFQALGMVVTVHSCSEGEWLVCGRAKPVPTPPVSACNQTASDVELVTWDRGADQVKRQVIPG